jgi:hypothetical protein
MSVEVKVLKRLVCEDHMNEENSGWLEEEPSPWVVKGKCLAHIGIWFFISCCSSCWLGEEQQRNKKSCHQMSFPTGEI